MAGVQGDRRKVGGRPDVKRLGDVAIQVRCAGQELTDAQNNIDLRRRLLADFVRFVGQPLAPRAGDAAQAKPPATALSSAVELLSPRKRQTLTLLLAGDAEKQIAAKLGISQHTVHVYVKQLYRKFEVGSRSELLAKWVDLPTT